MDLITFGGIGQRDRVTYQWDDRKPYETPYFAEAAAHWLQPARTIVLLTDKARQHENWSALRDCLSRTGSNIVDVSIPDCMTESENWELFRTLSSNVQTGTEIAFDITHGFRSLPVLALIAGAYLNVTRQCTVSHVLYGAYDPASKTKDPQAVDLAPFLCLYDWMIAADKFNTTGNGYALAKLIDAEQDERLEPLKVAVAGISQALHLVRPRDIMTGAAKLPATIEQSRAVVESGNPAFHEILMSVERGYGSLALDEEAIDGSDFVTRQLELAEWYLSKRQYTHCYAAAREWLPTLLCQIYSRDRMNRQEREDKELLLRGGKEPKRLDGGDRRESPLRSQWKEHALCGDCCTAWSTITGMRNDLLHAGFTGHKPHTASELIDGLINAVDQLRQIHDRWFKTIESTGGTPD